MAEPHPRNEKDASPLAAVRRLCQNRSARPCNDRNRTAAGPPSYPFQHQSMQSTTTKMTWTLFVRAAMNSSWGVGSFLRPQRSASQEAQERLCMHRIGQCSSELVRLPLNSCSLSKTDIHIYKHGFMYMW